MTSQTAKILSQISQLTLRIESEYPDLYKYLDETPLEAPSSEQGEISTEEMIDYLESLQDLLKRYIETHQDSITKISA